MNQSMHSEDLRTTLLESARAQGAVSAVSFAIDDIVFDPRTLLKCMFGCGDWGKGHTCPSREGSLRPWEYELVLRRYAWGVIVHAHDKKATQEISFELERMAFFAGRYMAFSMSDCALCLECAGHKGQECRNKRQARPAFHSVGIDVFATIAKFGLPLTTLRERSEQQNWYAAVFVE